MPHRIGYLKERIVSLENVCLAADEYNKARPRCRRRNFTIEWLNEIATDLANDRFVWDPPREKTIWEPKERHLRVPSVRSCIAQIAIFRVLTPIIDSRLPEMSFSSRKGKGGHALAEKTKRFLRTKGRKARYALYFDWRKFYDHITVDGIDAVLRRIIKDEWVLQEVRRMFEGIGPGLPIGYVGAHQIANLYAAAIFRKMRAVKGVTSSNIYMDNNCAFAEYKAPLKRALALAIAESAKVGLEIKDDWQIFPTAARGVRIAGQIIYPHRAPRLYRRIDHKLKRNIDKLLSGRCDERLAQSLASRFGWLKATGKEHILFNKLKREKRKCTKYILLTVLMNFS